MIRLTVDPAAVPKPALRYLLLPELKEMNPGNPIQNYLKCFMEQQKFFFDKESFQRREKLLVMPLKELPARELHDYGGFALKQADWAARLDNPDWQILLKMKTDGDLHCCSPTCSSSDPWPVHSRCAFRAEVALGRFDDALRTAKTMFAMSRHLGEHPTLIGNLVGFRFRQPRPRPAGGDAGAAGLPQPLLGADEPAQPPGPPGYGDGRRADWDDPMEFRDLDDSAPMTAGPTQQVHRGSGQAPQT